MATANQQQLKETKTRMDERHQTAPKTLQDENNSKITKLIRLHQLDRTS